jgi:16S rRNA (guanine966-N2)-methyltransferase
LRVVAGEFRGRRLVAPPRRSAAVRPTSDRVREALFSILGDIAGTRVLDLFCGTGALGIEAISRGAAFATFVDTHTALVRRNVAELGIGDRCEVVRSDARAFLRRVRRKFDLVLCDPPYRLAGRVGAALVPLIPAAVAANGRVVVESAPQGGIELELPVLTERLYGDTMLRIYGPAR